MSRRPFIPALAAVLALALGVAACGGGNSDTRLRELVDAVDQHRAGRGDQAQRRQRQDDPHGRLEELHRAEGARRDLRPGLPGRRLHASRRRSTSATRRRRSRRSRRNQISGYPEYTGTALLSFLKVPAKDIPTDEGQAYEQVKAGLAKQGIEAFPPTPFTSSNEVGLLKKKADELGVTKISDLKSKAGQLTLYGSPECRTRLDCLLGLEKVYGLKFKKFVPVDIDQRHEVLTSGQADVSIVFTTDPQIKRNNEVLLEDDKGMFPPYNSTFLMKKSTADAAGPDLAATIDAVNKGLTADVMQELNARVDLDKDTPEQAAQAYLKQFKLIPS